MEQVSRKAGDKARWGREEAVLRVLGRETSKEGEEVVCSASIPDK